MRAYSHVLSIPRTKPFENEKTRWTTFLGEFVKPLVKKHGFIYWFSYYTDFARFRIYTNDYASILPDLEILRVKFGLEYRKNEKGEKEESDYTLEADLGSSRFLGDERKNITPTERGLKVLNLVHAGCELFLHTLVKDGDYWREEICKNPNNPFDSASRSYIHLLHNLAQSDIVVYNFLQNQALGTMSEYYFSNAVDEGKIRPSWANPVRIQV